MPINNTFIQRLAVAITLLAHSVPSILSGGVNGFGNNLNQVGFEPIGLFIAWTVKLSHIVCAVLFLMDKYVKVASYATMVVLVAGIIMIHGREGWFVIGAGRGGMEFNVLLIFVLISIMYQNKLGRTITTN